MENVYSWLLNKDYKLTKDYIAKLFEVDKSTVSRRERNYTKMMEVLKDVEW